MYFSLRIDGEEQFENFNLINHIISLAYTLRYADTIFLFFRLIFRPNFFLFLYNIVLLYFLTKMKSGNAVLPMSFILNEKKEDIIEKCSQNCSISFLQMAIFQGKHSQIYSRWQDLRNIGINIMLVFQFILKTVKFD